MIEVIYKEEGQDAAGMPEGFSIPRNIRQIGFTDGNCKIYIEDYVYTFLGKIADASMETGCLAILVGEVRWNQGVSYVFIRGAVLAGDAEISEEHLNFAEDLWKEIQEEQEQYFPEQETVGWFLAKQQLPVKATEILLRTHLRYFGADKVLMMMDPAEREEAFFCYENSFLAKQRGYYIYYEKNTAMRDYMVEKESLLTKKDEETVEDEAVRTFRRIIKNKKESVDEEPEKKTEVHTSVFSYAATACLALAVLATGTGLYRNYRSFQKIRQDNETAQVSAQAYQKEKEVEQSTKDLTEKQEFLPEKESQSAEERVKEETISGDDVRKEAADNTVRETPNTLQDTLSEQAQVLRDEAISQRGGEESEDDLQQAQAASADEIFSDKGGETESILDLRQEADERKIGESREVTSQNIHPTYVIRPGDTIYEISMAQYGTLDKVEEICELNHITENQTIYPGQVLVLP